MWTRSRRIIGMLTLAIAAASCTVKDTEAPALAGPSELALSLSIQAVPDSVLQDGASQSSVTIDARGPNSQPVRGLSIRLDMLVDGAVGDFGTLSSRTVVTGDDGRARVTYTAPPRPTAPEASASIVTLTATPIGGDYRGETTRQIDIRVIPPGVILPPNRVNAVFTYSPTTVSTFQTVGFDASGTTDNLIVCGANCSYTWSFGDGGSSTGMVTTHEFRAAGSYVVTLRAANANGQSHQTSQTVTVGAGTPPTAVFVYSPTAPAVSQDIFFNAEASRAAPGSGRRIIAYDWDFGSGRTGSGATVAKRYDTAGTYMVTLTVTDDAFQQGTTSQSVTVGAGLRAALTVSPASPRVGVPAVFDGSGSGGPLAIVEYRFDFGDGSAPAVQATAIRTYSYAAPGTYIATLTVRDAAGATATTTAAVTVVP